MSGTFKRLSWHLCVVFLLGSLSGCQTAADGEQYIYAIESNGVVYGYMDQIIQRSGDGEQPDIFIKEDVKSISTALGMTVDTEVHSQYHLDPESGRFSSYEVEVDQESVQIYVSAEMLGNTAEITQNMGGGTKAVTIPPDCILTNFDLYPRILREFHGTGLDTKQYRILDLFDREIYDVTYTFQGTEEIKLAGKTFQAIVLESLNHGIGSKTRDWIDQKSGLLLKSEVPNLQTTYLADKSIKNKLRRFNRDAHIFAPAGVMIQDFLDISYIKVQATLDPIGCWITPETLNVRGQKFEGRVDNNLIEGTFEIRHERYDGSNPPPFPADYADNPELRPYLLPEDFIESDDPVLVRKAEELVGGAEDSWDAAKRLSRWVAEEIGYGIPGGGSARNTYDLRQGECGAHSRLYTAFCRAVGIPSRVVWGCMYVPEKGGSFGQHGWNEIYMGEAGWIPIDTTAREIDYCDSGHVRLGILTSKHIAYNPLEMEILDFQAGSLNFSDTAETAIPEEYQPQLGRYRGPRGVFEVLVQNNRLAVDIPDRMIFELREPDPEGRWFFVLTQDVHITFQEEPSGDVTGMTLINTPRIPKNNTDEEDTSEIPEELRPYCGIYPIPGQGEIKIVFRNKGLNIILPPSTVLELRGPDEEGIWTPERGSDRFSFVLDEGGIVRAIVIHETVHLKKIQ
jgi:hypothetical protein